MSRDIEPKPLDPATRLRDADTSNTATRTVRGEIVAEPEEGGFDSIIGTLEWRADFDYKAERG